jgi:hypothetical protein
MIGVAIPAGGLLGDCVVVAEESRCRSNRLIERLPVAINDLIAGTPGECNRSKECCRDKAWANG